ncbi:hypothetical protein [Streptomyces sp. NPDC048508]|uniref:DinB/UmuC family translesion DNA polymerase n=1 Tax=Streptomyces sp. NPDC048508 TaxID=3365561 RepID=UPI00371F62B8
MLALADDLGARLRNSDEIATGVTLSVRYADASSTRPGRTLPEPTQHTVLLARTASTHYDSLALQRARVRSIVLRADALRPAPCALRPAPRRRCHPAAHPPQQRRQATRDRSHRRPRPRPLRA